MTTLAIALPVFCGLRTLRTGPRSIRQAWGHARAWERCCMLLLFVPIPGPLDEIVALAVVARVLRRVEAEQ
jgi:hypothetical protein